MSKALRKSRALAIVSMFALLMQMAAGLAPVHATTVQSAKVNATRHKISTGTSLEIIFQLSASETWDASETIIVDLNEDSSGFDLDDASLVAADIDVDIKERLKISVPEIELFRFYGIFQGMVIQIVPQYNPAFADPLPGR